MHTPSHTATPWKVSNAERKNLFEIYGGEDGVDIICDFLNYEDAQFIVTAVNEYRENKETIEYLVKALRQVSSLSLVDGKAWKICTEALAKAGVKL